MPGEVISALTTEPETADAVFDYVKNTLGKTAVRAGDRAGRDQHLQPLARQGRDRVRQRTVQTPAVRLHADARLDDGNPPVHVRRIWG